MLPGNSRVLKCPFCGEEKNVFSLVSGNNMNGQQWSDLKSVYPMLPRVSPIQQCPACGKYYFRHEVKEREKEEGFSWELGILSYEQLKEAAAQFGDGLSKENRLLLNQLLLWAYNDKYNREGVETTPTTEEEKAYIAAVLDELIGGDGVDDIIRAEYYRERGRFEEAVVLLDKCHLEEGFIASIVEKMKSCAKEHKTIAFEIK